jgi:RHH-type transcriptional regulator, rel operon repressor / antitoxin RelB
VRRRLVAKRFEVEAEWASPLTVAMLYAYSDWIPPMLAIRLPADIEARLEDLAKRTGRTKSFYVREAIIEHLADIEDIYLAESRLEELRAGKSQTFSLADVERDLGLAD